MTAAPPPGRRPRVLLVGEGPPTSGGIPTFVERLLDDDRLRREVDIDRLNTTAEGKRPGAFSGANLRLALSHSREIRRRARRADVAHLNLAATPTLPLLRALVLCRAARSTGAGVILHAHTGQIEASMRNPAFRSLVRALPAVADALVVVSGSARRALPPLRGMVRQIDNGIDPAAFRDGPKQEPPLVTYVGTVAERKGLIDLRDALVRVGAGGDLPVRVRIVGDDRQEGPGTLERVRARFDEAGLADVRFTGALDREAVIDTLAGTSIFCLPSHWEGFPLSVLEAMAAGAAVIASSVGEVPRMLDGGRAGVLVPPGDVDALAEAIRHLAGDASERRRLGAAASDRVRREFGLPRMVDRLLALYREVARTGDTRRSSRMAR